MQKYIFSAVQVLGSRTGSVAVGVAGCTGCAWVWRQGAAPSLALAVPSSVSGRLVSGAVFATFSGVLVSVRTVGNQTFVRVRGFRAVLFSVALWWSAALRSAVAFRAARVVA